MTKLIYLKGLPASGKSTWAIEQVKKSNGHTKRLNKDDLRSLLDAGIYSRVNEHFVVKTEHEMSIGILAADHNLIIDNTGFNATHEDYYRELAKQFEVEFDVKFIDTPLDTCIERDAKRPNPVGEKVIQKMYDQYLKPKGAQAVHIMAPYIKPADKPRAIISDIDGTLAHFAGRSPYDYSKVSEDTVDDTVRDIVANYEHSHRVILMSGRPESCRQATEVWLNSNNIYYDDLFMRPTGDSRNDAIIKQELFDEHVRNNYQVDFVLDDRDRVVNTWRSAGLKVLQVAPGNF
jgi:predicted kinase